MYAFPVGLIVGRFQVFHKGHEYIIRSALDICNTVLIYINFVQEENTQKNPFSYTKRLCTIKKVFYDEIRTRRLIIHPLNDVDVSNNAKWDGYVLKTARETWFNDEMIELFIPKAYDISATALRLAMLRDDRDYWEKCVPMDVWDEYDDLRRLLIAAQKMPKR